MQQGTYTPGELVSVANQNNSNQTPNVHLLAEMYINQLLVTIRICLICMFATVPQVGPW
jgi:hypothetical protein